MGFVRLRVCSGKEFLNTLRLTDRCSRCYRERMTSLFFFFWVAIFSSVSWGVNPWGPAIEFGVGTITASPAKLHLNPAKLKLEIVESEGCEAKLKASSTIHFGESCEFLRGLYQYSFKQPGSDRPLRLYSEFLLHQRNSKSRAFIINSPIIVSESGPVTF